MYRLEQLEEIIGAGLAERDLTECIDNTRADMTMSRGRYPYPGSHCGLSKWLESIAGTLADY